MTKDGKIQQLENMTKCAEFCWKSAKYGLHSSSLTVKTKSPLYVSLHFIEQIRLACPRKTGCQYPLDAGSDPWNLKVEFYNTFLTALLVDYQFWLLVFDDHNCDK